METSAAMLQLLQDAQSPEPTRRSNAEKQLDVAAKQPGFGLALVRLAVKQDLPLACRQIATLLLKNFLKKHWTPESNSFEEPKVGVEEKALIRQELPHGLADCNNKIRTATAAAVVTIARWDVPEEWPSLPQDLLGAIASKHSPQLVAGAVRCLSMLGDEIDEEQNVQLIPALLPELLAVLKQPNVHEAVVQRHAVSAMHALTANCINALGIQKQQALDALLPHLEAWLQQFCCILVQPQKPGTSGECSAVKMEVLKALVLIFANLQKQVQAAASHVLHSCWILFMECIPLYQKRVIDAASSAEEAEVDSEGGLTDLNALVSQLFEFFITIAGSRRLKNHLGGSLHQLVHTSISYMQMTSEQEAAWSQDVNQFIADEDEALFTVRTSGCLLLDELFAAFPGKAAAALSIAVTERLREADQQKAGNYKSWWKVREATLLAVGSVAESLLEGPSEQHFQVARFLERVQQDLGATNVFLQGRALWLMSKFPDAVMRKGYVLQAAAQALAHGSHSVVQVGACRAVSALTPQAPPDALTPNLQLLYEGLGRLLAAFQEESLHLALDTLAAIIKADEGAAAAWQPLVTAPVLQIWAAHITDPVCSLATADVMEALAAVPAALPDLQAKALPVLVSIASQPEANPPALVEGAIDLAVGLLRPSAAQTAAGVHAALSTTIMRLLQTHTDPGVLQSCCEYLRALIAAGGDSIFSYGGSDPNGTVREIMSALKRLLSPDTGDSAPLYVGQVFIAILRAAPQQGIAAMAEILPAAISKLASATSSPLIVALLSVFAQLVLTNASQLIDFLSAAPSPAGSGSALDLLLQVWTERALEFRGMHDIKLSTSALALLLSTRHPALSKVQVKGKRLDIDSGIRTRSKAASQQERWQWVPAPAKLFALLADVLIEAEEGRLDEDEWESVSGSNDDSIAPSSAAGRQLLKDIPISVMRAAANSDCDLDEAGFEDRGPLADIDLQELISQRLKSLAREDQPLFESCCSLLSPLQLQAVHACF